MEMGLEEHLITIINLVEQFKPALFIIDPITSLIDLGSVMDVKSLLIRFISYLRAKNITIIFNELLTNHSDYKSIIGISSLVDTWIMLRLVESNGEYNRSIHIIKSRGGKTSSQVKEFKISDHGIKIEVPYIGSGGILFGSQKVEKALIDENTKESFEAQLSQIKNQLSTVETFIKNNNNSDLLEAIKFKFDLMDRQFELELKLQSIKSISQMNKKLRES
jgi:circadian clock protein KaiC